ncbi:hypothetical protein RHMOL_Rhmol03G0268200 [Rhododendron molle]|uniref:Uncharacterized protein n=1 Tax=Rhododendron molle TaxID=49168 RepID=A0ACC0PL73_RHOML|nr:hypothetical protein RHMOL_Rhmol03G0268200 [Rhododendron molle]
MRLFALPMVGFFFMAILQVARGQGFAPSPAPANLPANDGMSIFMHNFTICGVFFFPSLVSFWGGVVLGYCLNVWNLRGNQKMFLREIPIPFQLVE